MNCGRGTLTRPHPTKVNTHQYAAAKCHKLRCPDCGPIKAAKYRAAITKLAAAFGLQRMVTLTLDPGLIPADQSSVDYIQQVWSRFRTYLADHRKLSLTYIRVVELQKNGTAHYHLLIRETVTQDTLLSAWVECGGGHQVRIRFRDGGRGAAYVTKYVTKDLLAELPKGKRIVTTARGLRLFELLLPTGWQWSRMSFLDHVSICLQISWSAAYTSSIGDYFEHESPPDDLIEAVLYPKKVRKDDQQTEPE